MLKPVHLKAHAFEDYFSARIDCDLFEYVSHLRGIQRSRRHQNIELNRKQPEGCHVVLTSLNTQFGSVAGHWQKVLTHQLHNRPYGSLNVDSTITVHSD